MIGPLPDPTAFLERVFTALAMEGIDVASLPLDHICYRVVSMHRYEELRTAFHDHATLLSDAMIGGRPISTFRSHVPFVHRDRRLDVFELPAPKAGRPYPEGYEHVEFAVGEHPLSFAERYPGVAWDRSDAGKSVNPDVRLHRDGFSVKFHEHPLDHVIAHLDPR